MRKVERPLRKNRGIHEVKNQKSNYTTFQPIKNFKTVINSEMLNHLCYKHVELNKYSIYFN